MSETKIDKFALKRDYSERQSSDQKSFLTVAKDGVPARTSTEEFKLNKAQK